MYCVSDASVVFDYSVEVGLLHDDASHTPFREFAVEGFAVECAVLCRYELEGHAMEVGVGIYDAAHLRVYGLADEHACGLLGIAPGHHHGLGGGGGAVVERGVGDVHAGELSYHRLIFKDVVKRSL